MLETTVSVLPSDWFSFSGWPQLQLTHCKCLVQETNAISPARALTWTAQSKVKCTKHEAAVPRTKDNSAALIMDENNIYGYNKGKF